MFKNILDLKNHSITYIEEFLTKCEIEEKIDSYYVSVEIRSKTELAFYKSNKKQINRIDLIINEMWQKLVNDWTHFKLANEKWFNEHIGFRIYMFYFPCNKPLLTQYKKNVSYLIDYMTFDKNVYRQWSAKDEMSDMNMLDDFNIKFKTSLKKNEIELSNFLLDIVNNNSNSKQFFKNVSEKELLNRYNSFIDKDNSEIFALNNPEGFVFKYKKNNYQLINNSEETISRQDYSAEQTQYEYLLINFMKFWADIDDITSCIDKSYVKTVCYLFNTYIMTYETKHKQIEKNLDAESLQNPCIGHRFDICYENIPNNITINLCKDNELYKSIFKILLVNLKKRKQIDKSYMLMSHTQVSDWNDIVSIIENSSIEL